MCGRAVLANPLAIKEWFDVEQIPEMPARFNIAPSQVIAVIRTPRRLELLRWGIFRPERPRQINMRVESIARTANSQRRCLVVVDGFYEWKRDGKGKTSQPFLLREPDGHPFALGGVWSTSTTNDGEVIDTVAVLTCSPRPPVDAIHDRMPLIILKEGYARWLDHGADVGDLLKPNASGLVATPLSTYVNSPNNDDPKCIEPAAVAQPSPFG
jgi:putative SOS response-associated peptidase YedK